MSETGTLVHFDKRTPPDITKYPKYPANQSLIFQIQNNINKYLFKPSPTKKHVSCKWKVLGKGGSGLGLVHQQVAEFQRPLIGGKTHEVQSGTKRSDSPTPWCPSSCSHLNTYSDHVYKKTCKCKAHTPMQTVYLLHHYSNSWISIQVIMYIYLYIYIAHFHWHSLPWKFENWVLVKIVRAWISHKAGQLFIGRHLGQHWNLLYLVRWA